MTLMQKNLNDNTQNELDFNTSDIPRDSISLLATFYFFVAMSIIMFMLSFFFITFSSQVAFNYFFGGFWLIIQCLKFTNYDFDKPIHEKRLFS